MHRKEPLKLGSAETQPSWGAGVANPLETSHFLIIYISTSNLAVLRQSVYA